MSPSKNLLPSIVKSRVFTNIFPKNSKISAKNQKIQKLENLSITKNFFLSGGLNKDNIISAINLKKTSYFDVSSGVENSEGIKDKQLITEFIDKAKNII